MHSIYTRLDRWSKTAVLAHVLAELQPELAQELYWKALSLASVDVRLPPDVTIHANRFG